MKSQSVDTLSQIITRAELRASVFFSGPLCNVTPVSPHPTYANLHLLRRGKIGVWHRNGGLTTVEAPALLFFPVQIEHRLIPEANELYGAEVICSVVEFGSSFGRLLQMGLPESISFSLGSKPGLLAVLDALFDESSTALAGRDLALDRLIEVVVIHLLRQAINDGASQAGILAGLADPQIGPVLEQLHARPGDEWTLERMALVAGMSRSRFASRFTGLVGQPAGEYLSAWRVSVVQSALLKGRPMKALVDEVGYKSASSLTRAFSQVVGMTPSAWIDRMYAKSA